MKGRDFKKLSLGELRKWEAFMLKEMSADAKAVNHGVFFPRGYLQVCHQEITDLYNLIKKREKQYARRSKIIRWFAFFKRPFRWL